MICKPPGAQHWFAATFFEFFFTNESDANKFKNIIPTILARYPGGSLIKSDGPDNIVYQPGC